MKLELDENLGNHAADVLRAAGHDVATTPEGGLSSASDPQFLQACLTDQRCLVTLDMNSGNTLLFRSSEYFGIVVLRLPPRSTPADLADVVRTLVDGLQHADATRKVWMVQKGRIRQYDPGT